MVESHQQDNNPSKLIDNNLDDQSVSSLNDGDHEGGMPPHISED